jgi:hypothetical protein
MVCLRCAGLLSGLRLADLVLTDAGVIPPTGVAGSNSAG